MICEVCGHDKVIDNDGAHCEHCPEVTEQDIDELLAA